MSSAKYVFILDLKCMFRHFLIGTLILYLVSPEVDGWLFRRVFKGIGRGIKSIGKGIKNGIRKVGKTIEKIHCKVKQIYFYQTLKSFVSLGTKVKSF